MPKRQRESGRSQRGDGERPPRRSRSEAGKAEEKKPSAAKRRRSDRRKQRARGAGIAAGVRASRAAAVKAVRERHKGGKEEKGDDGKRPSQSGKERRKKGERKPPGTLERAITRVLAVVGALLVGIGRLVAVGLRKVAGPAAAVRRRLSAWVAALSRVVTPARGLLLAALGCALLLGLSQFVDYRGISIGADVYEPGISAVAPAPEVDRKELGTAHGYAMVPVAIVAALVLLFAARTGRWKLCRLAVLLGVAAVAVGILVDRPAGLDEGHLNRDFTGVEAKLLGGFWMQIFAGLGLAFTSFLLGNELKRGDAPAKRRRPARRKSEPKGRRRRTTTRPKAEGAGA